MLFFIADTHFGHDNIIKYCDRPFASVPDMDEALINNWNNKVKDDDEVFILGDMFFKSNNEEEILQRLNGRKRLIVGNHDESWMKKFDYSRYFETVDNYLEMSIGKDYMTLCHYPMMSWNRFRTAYMIHGHIHNATYVDFWPYIARRKKILNAGVEVNNYTPVTFEELVENNVRYKEEQGPEIQEKIIY